MSRLLELLNNVSTFNYYTGRGNFNQNNLPFGPDKANSGYSGEPYIKKPTYATSVTGLADVITHSATDVIRMSKFLKDVPKGPLFIAKQIGLQMTNPKMQSGVALPTNQTTAGQGFLKNISNSITKSANGLQNLVGSNRIWTPKNFLAQIGGAGAGKNFARQGLTLNVPKEEKNWYIVDQIEKGKVAGVENRIVSYLKKFSDPKSAFGQENQHLMYEYVGGPNSYLGLGKTSIYSYYSTFAASDVKLADTVAKLNGFRPIAPSVIINSTEDGVVANPKSPVGLTSLRNTDFRAYKVDTDQVYKREVETKKIRITDYQKYNTSNRIGIINTNAKSFKTVANDGVNMVAPYRSAGDKPDAGVVDINGVTVDAIKIRDMIKFRIKILDNDKVGYGTYLVFRAFITSMNDAMEAEWKAVRYTGRGETFYNYEGFTSTFDVSFKIVAFSKEEMKPLYQKLNYLKSSLTPDYINNRLRGNIAELTVGDYIKYQPGVITSVRVSLPEDAPWEIALNEPDEELLTRLDENMHELPQVLEVSLSFTPIYNFLPRKSADSPFIGIDSLRTNIDEAKRQDWAGGNRNALLKEPVSKK